MVSKFLARLRLISFHVGTRLLIIYCLLYFEVNLDGLSCKLNASKLIAVLLVREKMGHSICQVKPTKTGVPQRKEGARELILKAIVDIQGTKIDFLIAPRQNFKLLCKNISSVKQREPLKI